MTIDPIPSYRFSSLMPIVHNNAADMAKATESMTRLAGGMALVTAADSPSGLAMSERLRGLIGRYEAAISNTENAVAYTDTADSHLQTVSDALGRMQQLAISANDDTKSDTDRVALQQEFEQMQGMIRDTTSGSRPLTSFNGIPQLQGDSPAVGAGPEAGQEVRLTAADLSANSTVVIGRDAGGNSVEWNKIVGAGPGSIDISSKEGASSAIDRLSLATDHVGGIRAELGAQQSSLQSRMEGMRNAEINAVSQESQIRDTDVAREIVNLVKFLNLGRLNRNVLSTVTARPLAKA